MTMALTGVGPALEPFDLEGPAHEVSARWRRWKRSFQYYVDGQNITSAKRQRSLLLYLAGMPVQEKFETLTEDEDTDNLFERAVSALDKAFEFVANKRFERYKLRQMSQRTGETVSQFSTRLLGQSKYCDYGTDMEDHVCDQLLIGISDNRLRKKLLEVDDLTLAVALKKV